MRSALAIPLLIAVTASIAPAAAQRWCSISSEGYNNCSFASIADCRADVSGTGGNCFPEAPVGHRQPGNAKPSPPDTKLDALLDRVNKKNDKLILCRGC
jgi:uncharacterized protein DUF3551